MPSIVHVSDLHFGRPAVPEQIDAIAGLLSDGDLRPAFREAALNRLTPDGLITA